MVTQKGICIVLLVLLAIMLTREERKVTVALPLRTLRSLR